MKIRLKKIGENKNNPEIILGKEWEGEFISSPIVGGCFYMKRENGKYFRSSVVTEIIDENTFKTNNSVYNYQFI